MSTTSAYLTVRGIGIDVIYKDIKNLHIGVYPPLGRVRVAAPLRLDDDQVRLAAIQRLPWIKRQQQQPRAAPRQTERDMVTGESHYVDSKRLRLRVLSAPAGHILRSMAVASCSTFPRERLLPADVRYWRSGTGRGYVKL